MIRFCPRCRTERRIQEFFCEGIIDGLICNWDLSAEPIRPAGWRPTELSAPAAEPTKTTSRQCLNGHAVEDDDLICLVCGADVAEEPATPTLAPEALAAEHRVEGWRILESMTSTSGSCERFKVADDSGRPAVLELYRPGLEPEPKVYEALENVSREHVPEIFSHGRWEGRAYLVLERLTGETLADLGPGLASPEVARRIVDELGRALNALTEAGIRHRHLNPRALLVRSREPLDLVISGFGSARLSDFDLDVVAPLETSIHMAPEAVVGVVSPASDWWSLGMILLEQLTGGDGFNNVNPRAFLIQVLSGGLTLPDHLDGEIKILLAGLLTRDHNQRWQWPQVAAWLKGDYEPPAAASLIADDPGPDGPALTLGGRAYHSPGRLALRAAEVNFWDEALELMTSGALLTWLTERKSSAAERLRRLTGSWPELPDDFRLMLALKILNHDLPLILKGEIVTPGWLLANPRPGYELVSGPVPEALRGLGLAGHEWLERLQGRAISLRRQAEESAIALNEEALRLYLLNTSQTRLQAIWAERLKAFPEARHPRLSFLMECPALFDLDLIMLLSAKLPQFRSSDEVLEEVVRLCAQARLEKPPFAEVLENMGRPRFELHRLLNRRLEHFACCGLDLPDQWARDYRLQRRLPLAKILVLLCTAETEWKIPPHHRYLTDLLEYFEKKIHLSASRGSLVRMNTGLNSSNIDLMDLETPRLAAASIADHIINRQTRPRRLDPMAFETVAAEGPEGSPRPARFYRPLFSRLTRLFIRTDQYKKDTGLEGLHLGFPFLIKTSPVKTQKPRVMPLLLWPVKLIITERARLQADLVFDDGREEVRLNHALEQFIGSEALEKWRAACDDLLSRSSLDVAGVMEILAPLASAADCEFQRLEPQQREAPAEGEHLACAAVLFHSAFMGQAVSEDLRVLKNLPPSNGALNALLGLTSAATDLHVETPAEENRYLISDSDPSQEAAVWKAMRRPGLLVEGPPGTGKSQTIVNIVANAIGGGRSVLIVCQKRAALEVVSKRLVAEGLADRLALIDDVGKDRRPLIKALRDQLDGIFGGGNSESDEIENQRAQLALAIKHYESRLDQAHEALYAPNPEIEASFRTLLGEIMVLAEKGPRPAPQLHSVLKPLNRRELRELINRCVPLMNLWLAADYEDNPLRAIKPFDPETEKIKTLNELLEAFAAAEKKRLSLLSPGCGRIRISATASAYETIRSWLDLHAPQIDNLSDNERELLRLRLPLFKIRDERSTARGREIMDDLQRVINNFEEGRSSYSNDFSRILAGVNDSKLTRLRAAAGLRPSLVPLWRKCLPGYWLKLFRIKKFLKPLSLRPVDEQKLEELQAAIDAEGKWRPWRNQLRSIEAELQAPSSDTDDVQQALSIARQHLWQLGRLGELIEGLTLLPENKYLERAVLEADKAAWVRTADDYRRAFQRWVRRLNSLKRLTHLAPWVDDDWREHLTGCINSDADSGAYLRPVLDRLAGLEKYQRFRCKAAALPRADLEFFRLLRASAGELSEIEPGQLAAAAALTIDHEARQAWKIRLEEEFPELLASRESTADTVRKLSAVNGEMISLNRRLLKTVNRTSLENSRGWEDLTRLTGPRARSLRQFIAASLPLGLLKLRPVWLMNPDTASRLLPLRPSLFDMIIYDEASQLPVEYAVPTLYRGHTVVISGDEKQMPPARFFTAVMKADDTETVADEDEAESEPREPADGGDDFREITDCTDLLQLGRRSLPRTMLEIHYRSRYRELISFSNEAFYGGRLSVPNRHTGRDLIAARPLEFIDVGGLYENQTNRPEAEKVLEIIKQIWARPFDRRPSAGVVTFNQKQAELIEDVIEAEMEADQAFQKNYEEESRRLKDGEDMSFFVKNGENVQGDERDVIIFSSTFGRDNSGRFLRNFGILGHRCGERRLNVAITRARRKVMLINSMPVHQISDMLTTQRPALIPRDYLQMYWAYARALSAGDFGLAQEYLRRLGPKMKEEASQAQPLDDFQRIVARQIKEFGWEPVRGQAGPGDAFALDFLLESPRTGHFFLAVECDSPRHFLLTGARARELWRPKILRQVVPAVYRVSSRAWLSEPESEREQLRQAIVKAYENETVKL